MDSVFSFSIGLTFRTLHLLLHTVGLRFLLPLDKQVLQFLLAWPGGLVCAKAFSKQKRQSKRPQTLIFSNATPGASQKLEALISMLGKWERR